MCVVKLSNRYSYSFGLILTKLDSNELCGSSQKTGTDSQNFVFKMFAIFLKFCFELNICNSSSGVI